ncbi:DUF5677 domain-containing protein [Anaerorhabdus sp.]|uniref:DUF5677 domain-containing protein n=1 Tax=Anaerorhabdus sp. TaxID=1872524 RepID=UPI002B1FF0F7|nr:DUF5677 domain-containing protein [Anaerorhabdus sp.]MEA4875637.1 DUF5677 domain-containing protein [Anaerorhabdus sp.]
MEILECINAIDIAAMNEIDKTKILCFFHFKETGEKYFNMVLISNLFQKFGFNPPNTSRLKEKITKGKNKVLMISKENKGSLEFIPLILQKLEKEYGLLWNDTISIESNSEILDEMKFCGKRHYLDRLIKQINHTYKNNCYDACAILLRRLFEVVLVLAYQHTNIDDEIKDSSGKGYVMLEQIVTNAKVNSTLKLSRIKNEFDTFRKIGNFSAHNITYTAGKKDIDDIKLNYRVMLEELYSKAGLI